MTSLNETIRVLDVVALTVDLPDRGLQRGQVGTVVEALSPGVFEVEFSDRMLRRRAFASIAVIRAGLNDLIGASA